MFHKKMAYYLYLISRHHKVLPMFILKLLVESLVLHILTMHCLCGVLPWPTICWLDWLKCTIVLYESLVV